MKVGFGAFGDPFEAVPLVGWARAAGFVVMSHSGGASIPGSSPITVDHLLAMDPTIAGHANGGTTSLPDPDLERLVDGRGWPSRSSRRATSAPACTCWGWPGTGGGWTG